MNYEDIIKKQAQVIQKFFSKQGQLFEQVVEEMCKCLEKRHKILVFGNGGSAAQAQHFSSELVNRFLKTRRALPALSLTVDTSTLTSIANDVAFDQVFSRQIEALGKKGDVALALSTSGNSPNVLQALQTAKKEGLFTVALTGKGGGKAGSHSDILIDVPSMDTPRIQEIHIFLLHLLSQEIEDRMG